MENPPFEDVFPIGMLVNFYCHASLLEGNQKKENVLPHNILGPSLLLQKIISKA